MLNELEQQLPSWARKYTEDQFVLLLGRALDYICRGANAEARGYAFARTGVLVQGSSAALWHIRYGGAGKQAY